MLIFKEKIKNILIISVFILSIIINQTKQIFSKLYNICLYGLQYTYKYITEKYQSLKKNIVNKWNKKLATHDGCSIRGNNKVEKNISGRDISYFLKNMELI